MLSNICGNNVRIDIFIILIINCRLFLLWILFVKGNKNSFIIFNCGNFHDVSLSPIVESAYHALAIDEKRAIRHPGQSLARRVVEAVRALGQADIVIGIPSYNNARTIGHVVRAAQAGLIKYFPSFRGVIVNSDGGSQDGTPQQVIEAVQRVKAAGILTSVTVILGLGGTLQLKDAKAASDRHTLATARALSAMDPDYAGALTMTLVPGTPMYADAESGKFKLITPFESLQELLTIIKNSNFTRCFFSSMHASNYFSVRGTLPQDKEKMIRALEKIIKQGDPALLRPEFMRGL